MSLIPKWFTTAGILATIVLAFTIAGCLPAATMQTPGETSTALPSKTSTERSTEQPSRTPTYQEPLPTSTIARTAFSTTPTRVQPASAATSTATRSIARGRSVEGEGWRLTVLDVTNEGQQFVDPVGLNSTTLTVKEGFMLKVSVELQRLSGEAIGADYIQPAVVRDSQMNEIRNFAVGFLGVYVDMQVREEQNLMIATQNVAQFNFIFAVPEGAAIVEFTWSNLPPVTINAG